MSIIETLKSRGLVQDVSDPEALSKLAPGDTFYVGFDPSAASLQLGNLVPLIVSMHLARAGLKPIILFGGATGSIGDPGGRNSERQLMDLDTIENNVTRQVAQVKAIMQRAGVNAEFVNNYDWTRDFTVLQFLRDIGKHFTVNYMIAKEVVKTRLDGDGISFTEFSYMLLQSFDFLHLYETRNCRMQIGGSEQWGNITSGLELLRRKGKNDACAFSFPLILDSQGKKFGKSAGGAIWLDPEMASPYKLHQYFLNVDDATVVRYLKVFTFMSDQEISSLESQLKENPGARAAQKALADSICTLVHGETATSDAKRCAEVLFGGSLEGLSDQQLMDIFSDVPSSTLSKPELAALNITDLFAKSGVVKSKGEARTLITGGGAYINNERVSDAALAPAAFLKSDSAVLVLRAGKKNYHLVRIQ